VKVEISRDVAGCAADGGAIEYRIYSDLSQIQGLARQWNDLVAISSCNRVFASIEWYVASCSKQNSWTPWVVAVSRDGRLSGILPLVIDDEDKTAKFPHHAADYNDLIAADADHSLIADLLNRAITADHGFQRILLSRLRPDSLCARAMPLLQSGSKFECGWREIDTYRYIALPRTFDSYLASRSKTFRKDIRRSLNAAGGKDLVLQELQPEKFDPDALPDLLINLAVARHQERCSFTRSVWVRDFLKAALPPVFRRRSLRAFAILRGERITALDLCMVRGNGMVTWNGGFLPEVERFSPGTALFAFEIQQAIASGLQEFDFIRGEEGYKRSWTNSSYLVGELELLAGKTK